MKRITLYITLPLLLLMSACADDFLNQTPTNSVPDKLVATPDNAPKIFNGAWNYLFDSFFTYANPGYSALLRQDDMMGNDVVAYPGKYGFSSSYQYTDTPDKTVYRTRVFWTMLYKAIDNCNQVIAITSPTKHEKLDRAKGMALTLRAFAYFTLVQHYQFTYAKDAQALAVPLYLLPTTDGTLPKGKSTVAELYNRILLDLTQAEELLTGSQRVQKFEPDLNVVKGMLARVYLLVGDWDKAAQAASAAIVDYPLMPTVDYAKGFNDAANSEWIWAHPQTPEQNVASYSFNYLDVVSPVSYYYSFMADPHFRTLFTEPTDVRASLFEWVRDGYLAYKKFLFRKDNTADIVLMRSSEMYLIRSEALLRGGSSLDEAVAPLNELRFARGITAAVDASTSTREELLQVVLEERRRELWGEGFSLTDLLRTQQSVNRLVYTGDSVSCRQIPSGQMKQYKPNGHYFLQPAKDTPFVPNSPYYLYAIPESEETANPEL